MAITYRNMLVAIDDENFTARIMDSYDAQFEIEQEGDWFIVTEKIGDMDHLVLETDSLFTAFQFVKDWT
jgi:hypothetical protein